MYLLFGRSPPLPYFVYFSILFNTFYMFFFKFYRFVDKKLIGCNGWGAPQKRPPLINYQLHIKKIKYVEKQKYVEKNTKYVRGGSYQIRSTLLIDD